MATVNDLDQPISSADIQTASSPILFRLRRKRHAEQHGALVLSLKRVRYDDSVEKPILCHLADVGSFPNANIIDVNLAGGSQSSEMMVDSVNDSESNDENENILSTFGDAVELSSEKEPVVKEDKVVSSEITLNGVPLQLATNPAAGCDSASSKVLQKFVYDYYWSADATDCTMDQIETVRLATANDYVFNEDDSSSDVADDDDDSNDENNWRNDYPDELEDSSTEEEASEWEGECDDIERGINELEFGDDDDDGDDEGSYSN